jgi:hypothetical protein
MRYHEKTEFGAGRHECLPPWSKSISAHCEMFYEKVR